MAGADVELNIYWKKYLIENIRNRMHLHILHRLIKKFLRDFNAS
jgi:hypothetical protein